MYPYFNWSIIECEFRLAQLLLTTACWRCWNTDCQSMYWMYCIYCIYCMYFCIFVLFVLNMLRFVRSVLSLTSTFEHDYCYYTSTKLINDALENTKPGLQTGTPKWSPLSPRFHWLQQFYYIYCCFPALIITCSDAQEFWNYFWFCNVLLDLLNKTEGVERIVSFNIYVLM